MRIVVGGVIQAGQPEIETLVIGPGIPLADVIDEGDDFNSLGACLLYTSPSPRDRTRSRMPSSA